MPDMMSTGISGLRALQRALDTTSHNIANAGTEGYSRQRVDFQARIPSQYGNGWVGNGVEAATVRRTYDQFLVAQTRVSGGTYERLNEFAAQAERINNMLGDSSTGLSASLQRFANALQGVATTPASIPARQTLLAQGSELAQRLTAYDQRLRVLDQDINARFTVEARDISSIAANIADLNGQITAAYERSNQPPNDLLDQRDRLIDQISQKLNVSVVPENNSTLNVFVGNGQALVLGTAASDITVTQDQFDPERRQLALRTPSGPIDITQNLRGGSLGGLIDFRREMLDPARNALGRMATALTEQMNAQHRAGMDLSGVLGGDFFRVGGVETSPANNNSGAATLAVTRTAIGELTEYDYTLESTGSGMQLKRADTGLAIPMTGSGTVADPFLAAGMSIVTTGAAAIGDRFMIRPTRNAVAGFGLAVTDASRVAAAAPSRTSSSTANTGSASISAGEVVDATDPALRSPVVIDFTSPTSYSINGSGSFAYSSGAAITVNGWSVTLSGAAATGDQFSVLDNSAGRGDNRNALLLADTLASPALDNGTASVAATIERFTAEIGLQTRSAQINRDAQAVVNRDDIAARDSVSGVNLDEEAANLLRYQQAYQAAAKVIAISSTLFDSLLGALRR
ncbi:MAG: flagellar hook-associated protein FlgK [Steroidobacteraceae bacterium]